MTSTHTDDAEQQAHLEAERDFLMRSLDDLEAERTAGAIDDESYRQLHDDYTARAAAVLRALRDGVDTRPPPPRTSWSRRALVIGCLIVFAVVVGAVLAAALGARLPGETSSGNSGPRVSAPSERADRRKELQAAVARNPDDIASRLLLARELEVDNDLAGALAQYDEIIRRNPSSAEAYAQSGRILYLTARQVPPDQAAALVEQSRSRLDTAINVDPTFVDARFFRAIVRANEYQDFAGAQGDLQRYLVAAPNGEFADQARQLLADVTNALQSPSSTVPRT